ncbi:hypothetical protein [Cupriavidus sp. D39]|uniref:hypothetical protein n=1 Tax=Cupriavidus sp. D39 TaxID=2997877 RepID=UPI00226D8BAE|nr:hypothetical protein [Cupriavidus sp. D39]MCY0854076.1 hypothetical protein [Cupriavidus sp. D39]
MSITTQAAGLRSALRESLPSVDQAGADPDRDPFFTYLPPSHARALDPDACIVEGIRGAGKSFWWAHLSSTPHQHFISGAFPEARLKIGVKALQAFGAQQKSDDAPSKDVLAKLIQKYPARAIWRAVCAHKAGFDTPFPKTNRWDARVEWVQDNPEDFDELLQKVDQEQERKGQTVVILFDALDRLAEDWASIRPLAKGLFQVTQDLRATKRIRFKLFVRPDMLQDPAITAFPDASKLLARRAKLDWRRADLYALFFQCLANAINNGVIFRDITGPNLRVNWQRKDGGWLLPSVLRADERLQEQAFILLAGKAMASGPSGYKRGKPEYVACESFAGWLGPSKSSELFCGCSAGRRSDSFRLSACLRFSGHSGGRPSCIKNSG